MKCTSVRTISRLLIGDDEHQNVCVCVLVCLDGDCGYDLFESDSEEEEEEVKDRTENNIFPKKKTAFQVRGGGIYTLTYSHMIHSYLHSSQHSSLLLSCSCLMALVSSISSLIYCNTIFIKLLKSSHYGILKSSWLLLC